MGVDPGMAMQKLYGDTALGHRVTQDFDVVAANSVSSFTLGCLIENFHAARPPVESFLERRRTKGGLFVCEYLPTIQKHAV
jgi:hypothetical protein